MSDLEVPTFPEFVWNDYSWITSAKLAAWDGYQIREGAYGSVSESANSNGKVRIVFAPEGREEGPLSEKEIGMVQWVVDHQASIHDAMLDRLMKEYPTIRERYLDWFDDEEGEEVLPEIRNKSQLKEIVGIVYIHVHQIERAGMPFVGVELGCNWDNEHGLGILLHGNKPLEVGGADTAILLWLAEKYSKMSS